MRSKVRRKVFKKMYSFCGSKKGRNVGKKNSAQLDRVIDGQRKTENEVAFSVASLQRLEARGSMDSNGKQLTYISLTRVQLVSRISLFPALLSTLGFYTL
jgi:hypothetical protein